MRWSLWTNFYQSCHQTNLEWCQRRWGCGGEDWAFPHMEEIVAFRQQVWGDRSRGRERSCLGNQMSMVQRMGEGAVGTAGRFSLGTLILTPDSEQNHFQLGPFNGLMEELRENVSDGGKNYLGESLPTYFARKTLLGLVSISCKNR